VAKPDELLEYELLHHPERVLVIAGTGVALASCSNQPQLSWKGLLRDGLQRCSDLQSTDAALLSSFGQVLDNPDATVNALIAVAQFVSDELSKPRYGVFSEWLHDAFHEVTPDQTDLITAICSCGTRIATTNYDGLIESVTNRKAVSWTDKAGAARFFREWTPSVLHLHGYFRVPESVILGARSYGDVCKDDLMQSALRGTFILGTVVFVGCGAGLDDPNFSSLLDWARHTLKECHHRHFILVCTSELTHWRLRLEGLPIVPIPYGTEHSDLSSFVRQLSARVESARSSNPGAQLTTAQFSFEERWAKLDAEREQIQLSDYFARSKALVMELQFAGGKGRAATAFSSRLLSHGKGLLAEDAILYGLDAAQWLLELNYTELATLHINELSRRTATVQVSPEVELRLNHLTLSLQKAICAYVESVSSIEEAILRSSGDERLLLEAERMELQFLDGDFTSGSTPQNGEMSDDSQ